MPDPATPTDTATPDQPTTYVPHVELLRWPAQDDRRRLLASLGEPRILLLTPGGPTPALIDDIELWIAEGGDPSDLVRGVAALQRRILDSHIPPAAPALDDDGLLWFRGRWIAVSDTQLPVVDLLVQNYQRLVRNEDLSRTYLDAGGGTSPASFRTLIGRVAKRLSEVGLKLHVVRRRGVILAIDEPPPIGTTYRL